MNLEEQLQAKCYKWYRNEWYQNPDWLWATFNEGKDLNIKLSRGLRRGASDFMYNERNGRGFIPLELKYPGMSHPVQHLIRQAEFILNNSEYGGFVDNFDDFCSIIKGGNNWLSPQRVLGVLKNYKNKSFIWDSSIF